MFLEEGKTQAGHAEVPFDSFWQLQVLHTTDINKKVFFNIKRVLETEKANQV